MIVKYWATSLNQNDLNPDILHLHMTKNEHN